MCAPHDIKIYVATDNKQQRSEDDVKNTCNPICTNNQYHIVMYSYTHRMRRGGMQLAVAGPTRRVHVQQQVQCKQRTVPT
mmetsp:Transcript_21997/g.57348  ORF Transcript_21997/g.57348 Transcript_21997/m.57348 type:complete len:80 (-) Transcript_21997:242-481(-)